MYIGFNLAASVCLYACVILLSAACISLSVFLPFIVFTACLSVFLCACLFLYKHVCLCVCIPVCCTISYHSVCLHVILSAYFFIYPSVCVFVCLCGYLSCFREIYLLDLRSVGQHRSVQSSGQRSWMSRAESQILMQ